VASGTPAPTYQWQKDGTSISGATSSTYSISSTASSDAGSYTVVVTNSAGSVTSSAATLAVTAAATAPSITTQPSATTVTAGSTASFSVVASGTPAPTYQWKKDGTSISGATSSTYSISSTAASDAGSYTVVVTNSAGSVTSSAATLTVTAAATAPSIATQPSAATVTAGSTATFSVVASGTATLTYQWRKDGTAISGATSSTYSISSTASSDAGSYTVVVTNGAGTVLSQVAELLIIPAGTAATHSVVGGGYSPGGAVVISSRLSYTGTLSAVAWSVLLPPGWTYVSGSASQGETRPAAGTSGLLEWAWTSLPASPVEFTYTVQAPANATGAQAFVALAIARLGGKPYQLLAQPDPLQVTQLLHHAADTNRDFKISLLELTRIIELYNTRNGSTRTGRYRGQTGTEDNFAPDAETLAAATVTLGVYHSADSNRDGRFSLLELTRVIELYNTRLDGARTGRYQIQVGSEDGYAPDPR
jgi:hypothetical protein